jgi:NAD+ synthase (glutamine-hydrolysing)
MAQINLCVGDISGNVKKIIDAAHRARQEHQAELVIFPELSLTGYPPEDLLLRPSFLEAVEQAIDELKSAISGIKVLVGYPVRKQEKLYNAAGLLGDGMIHVEYRKQALPNYSVFDEKRYFSPGCDAVVFNHQGVNFGITICEDIWENEPVEMAVKAGAQVILNLNASPFDSDKPSRRETLLQTQAIKHGVSIIYVNLVGGQDELVFDGGSMAVRENGHVVYRAGFFQEALLPVNCDLDVADRPLVAFSEDKLSLIHRALVMGIRDYVQKNGFHGAVLGLSGGIDSALVLALAVEALGADQVEVLSMPSRYTLDMSNEDALLQAEKLAVKHSSIPIEKPFSAFMELLSSEFEGLEADTTEENIQARCRGILLMAMSNKKGKILLTTGNKSEMSVGYATLYGDMAGGFAPIKDCPKMLVYELARYCNRDGEVIPQRVIDRPPSAELRPDQKDTDSLPDYEILDEILELYVEQDASAQNIVERGFEEETVRRIIRLVDINEYKRRQAPPGVKITQRAYGRDRRYPMTNRFRSDML